MEQYRAGIVAYSSFGINSSAIYLLNAPGDTSLPCFGPKKSTEFISPLYLIPIKGDVLPIGVLNDERVRAGLGNDDRRSSQYLMTMDYLGDRSNFLPAEHVYGFAGELEQAARADEQAEAA
jgi:hypothetical protein